jgi:hypothetical protein
MVNYSVQPKWLPRLMSRVEGQASGCWLWLGYTDKGGYGRSEIALRCRGVHQAVFEAMVGPIPDGLFVLHTCDTPACCNPEHLYLGTQKQNIQDRDGRGHTARGQKQHLAKLTDAGVREIRSLSKAGNGAAELARRFGVTR